VQWNLLPQALLGCDLIYQSAPGTGKTGLYVLAVLYNFERGSGVTSLVLCPTRELAYQIDAEFKYIGKYYTSLKTAVLAGKVFDRISLPFFFFFFCFCVTYQTIFFYVTHLGGVPVLSDRTTLKDTNPSIIIGTPGNIYLYSHHKLPCANFSSGRILALADDRTLKLNGCTQLVVDECDDLLTNNLSTVEKIFAHLPDNKQVLMTSSTINSEVEQVPLT